MNLPTNDDNSILFAYGTLMRGFCRHWLLEDMQFLGEATTAAKYRLVNCGSYPGLVAAVNGVSIQGEIWEVFPERWAALDLEEGVADGLYIRRFIELQPPHHQLQAQAYFYARPADGLPDCGERWMEHQ